jgi:hypothetical protein
MKRVLVVTAMLAALIMSSIPSSALGKFSRVAQVGVTFRVNLIVETPEGDQMKIGDFGVFSTEAEAVTKARSLSMAGYYDHNIKEESEIAGIYYPPSHVVQVVIERVTE